MPRISRFKRRLDDRTGFYAWEIQLIKDGPWKVMSEAYDTPPPSKSPLGGEGDVAAGESRANSSFTVANTDPPTGSALPVVYVTTLASILPSTTQPWLLLCGSPGAVVVATTPNIARGVQTQVLTLQCADSAVTLTQGSAQAIAFMDSRATLQLTSGMVITLVFDTANQAWNEASRFRP